MCKKCIVCEGDSLNSPVEHIVPESLGNQFYVLPKDVLCGSCNKEFSKFEGSTLLSSFVGFLRVRHGIKTKKGKAAVFSTGGFQLAGIKPGLENQVYIKGLENIKAENIVFHENGSYTITIPDFESHGMPAAKLLLKIGFEAMYKSQRKIFEKYAFDNLRNYLLNKSNQDWPFIRSPYHPKDFKSIPSFKDKYMLNKAECKLQYWATDRQLIFSFSYFGVGRYCISLLNREIEWMKDYVENEHGTSVWPLHMKDKINPYLKNGLRGDENSN